MRTPPTTAWDLVYAISTAPGAAFLVDPDLADDAQNPRWSTARPESDPSGWTGDRGPALPLESWPRSPVTGSPLHHAITLRLPDEYLEPGSSVVGVSLFEGEVEDADADAETAGAAAPGSEDGAGGRPHPRLTTALARYDRRRYAVVRLVEHELAPGPSGMRPADAGGAAARPPRPVRDVWLVPRRDPNTGLPTRSAAYRDVRDERTGDWMPWADGDRFRYANHLGGSYIGIDFVPELGPRFLQLDRSAGLSLKSRWASNGVVAVDLDTGLVDVVY